MRGKKQDQTLLFFVIEVESRIDGILVSMDVSFSRAYSRTGRPIVPPERLLKALLLMALYSIPSERQLIERIDSDFLFRWILDHNPEDTVFDTTVFTHNRARLDEHGLTGELFDAVVKQAIEQGLCIDDHFSSPILRYAR